MRRMKLMPASRLCEAEHLFRARPYDAWRTEREHAAEADEQHRGRDSVDELGADREENAAEYGAADHRGLARDRAQRHGAGEQLGLDDLGRQCAAGGSAERAGNAGGDREREERPQLGRPRTADDGAARRTRPSRSPARTANTNRRGKWSAICPAGSASTSSGRNSASPISPRSNGIPVDRVHLPADGHDRHLRGEAHHDERRPRGAHSRAAAALQASVAEASSEVSHTEKPAGSGLFEPSSGCGSRWLG